MPVGVQNQEFLAHNANRRYPLADDASCEDTTASFKLPTSFIVGLAIPVRADLIDNPGGFFLRTVSAYAGGYGLVFGYQPTSGPAVSVASALIPRTGFTKNSVYTVGGIGDYANTVGHVTIGKLEDIDAQPPGSWSFTLAAGRIDPDAIRPQLRGVSAIVALNGDQRSQALTGVVTLSAGRNFQLAATRSSADAGSVVLNAISGEGTVENCVCDGNVTPPSPIETINMIRPTADGNLLLTGSDCLTIEPIENGLYIRDICAQPCCGPRELERITADLAKLGRQAVTVEDFVARLGAATTVMDLIVLGSRLGDRGCSTET